MITLERPAYYDSKRYNEYCGLSTDEKTTISAYNGDEFYEINTGKYYKYNQVSNEWVEQPTSGGGGGGSGVQSDWNQNDDTQPDYVKNRPFYTGDLVETMLVEESTVSFEDDGGVYVGQLESTFSPTVGETYKVSWDGTTYESTCVNFDGTSAIGNLSLMGGGSDTGEPFLAVADNGKRITIITADTSTSHTISISGVVAEIVKIDEKYIPELSSYMNKANPTGTGAFSLNRKADTTVGKFSFAEGFQTTASSDNSHAEGAGTTASSTNSHAEGFQTTASSDSSHAEGFQTTASGPRSHAEGLSSNVFSEIVTSENPTNDEIINAWNSSKFSLANGVQSHVEGENCLALGSTSHAEGFQTTASGINSHAEGAGTTASSTNSHAEGFQTTASGANAHAEGRQTKASSVNQHAQGKFNIEDTSNTYAHIVGNGDSDTARSNAHTLDWSGNAWYAGTVEGKALILPSSTSGSTKKFKITVDDSGTLKATEVT